MKEPEKWSIAILVNGKSIAIADNVDLNECIKNFVHNCISKLNSRKILEILISNDDKVMDFSKF